jgi:GxxExxY protein
MEKQADLNLLAEKIIGCAYKVSNTLGVGFLEKVYENALALEIQKAGLKAKQQHPISIRYEGAIVGEYIADILVEDCLLVELKAVEELNTVHSAQCLNYLKATGLKICLLMNFGKTRVKVRRLVNHF